MIYDVIIVGAGVSGLAAAKKLSERNMRVLVIEARDRIGGRIYTDRSLGFPIDLGASWAHDLPNNIIANQKTAFNIELLPFSNLQDHLNGHVVFNEKNKKLNLHELEKIKKFFCGISKTLGFQTDDANLAQLIENYHDPELTQTESIQVKDWLTNFMECWFGSELSETSIKAWKNMQDESRQAYVLNGYDQLIHYLAKEITIIKHCEVQQINYSSDIIKIQSSQGIYEALHVIVTLPIGVLKSEKVKFIPSLPNTKLSAINAIGCGSLEKVVLHFSNCFWDEQALSIQILPCKNSPVLTYINYYALIKKPVLVALYGGNTAKKISKKKSTENLIAPLKKIYGDQYRDPIDSIHTQWNQDPYTQCSYAFLPRGINDNCFDMLAEPINNRLFFAGEAASKKMYATVHGAYLSGLQAAESILQINTIARNPVAETNGICTLKDHSLITSLRS